MPLFQKSVLKDYLQKRDTDSVKRAYKTFQGHFLDTGIQKNIRQSQAESRGRGGVDGVLQQAKSESAGISGGSG